MSAISQAQRAYAPGAGAAAIRTPRSIEFEVIARITHRLKTAIEARNTRGLIDVLHENRKLWTALAADVASSDNALPQDLRARIFYLAEFTGQHTSKVLRNEATAVPLLEINAAILGGLKIKGADA